MQAQISFYEYATQYISSGQNIVIENITHGFKNPNVLKLKLGAKLWDEKAKPEIRACFDKVLAATTSGSLGFRINSMRTYKGVPPLEILEDLRNYSDSNVRVMRCARRGCATCAVESREVIVGSVKL
jgi:hypothetical protein